MSTEAMKLALEALEMVDCDDNDRDFLSSSQCYQLDKAITALREALAEQPAQPSKPLTKEQMYELSNKANDDCMRDSDSQAPWSWTYHFVRAIEAAHGIKGDA